MYRNAVKSKYPLDKVGNIVYHRIMLINNLENQITSCSKKQHLGIVKSCAKCERAICRNCSHIVDGIDYCRQCQSELVQQWYDEAGICPNCGDQCQAKYENNGFTEPNGPSKIEIVGYYPCGTCGYHD